MKKFAEIVDVVGRQVIDSRGNPTVEVDVYVDDGINTYMGRAAVPSGQASNRQGPRWLRRSAGSRGR